MTKDSAAHDPFLADLYNRAMIAAASTPKMISMSICVCSNSMAEHMSFDKRIEMQNDDAKLRPRKDIYQRIYIL
jgi:hypothetical protein